MPRYRKTITLILFCSLTHAYGQFNSTFGEGVFLSSMNRTGSNIFTNIWDITSDFNNITVSKDTDPSWLVMFNRFQASITGLGIIANSMTFITLKYNGQMFSPVIRILLIHQSFIDATVCLFATLILAIPPMRVVGKNMVSLLICQCWHSQAAYWCVMDVSINNLVIMAWERFLAITKPFTHAKLSQSVAYKAIRLLYVISPIAMSLCFVQVRYHDGLCLPEFYFKSKEFKDIMYGFGIWCFFCLYAIPCGFFFFLYGGIVYTLVQRVRHPSLAHSRVIDTATTQLTRTAMLVTAWFIISLGYDCWYYMLGYAGVVLYIKNSAIQKAGIFLAMSNSMVNPLIYALFMPAYRQSLCLTLGLHTRQDINEKLKPSNRSADTLHTVI